MFKMQISGGLKQVERYGLARTMWWRLNENVKSGVRHGNAISQSSSAPPSRTSWASRQLHIFASLTVVLITPSICQAKRMLADFDSVCVATKRVR